MSLETLLEAAKYLEYKTKVKARGEEPYDYCTFSKLYSNIDLSGNSTPPQRLQRHVQSSPSHSNEDYKERRRTSSSSRETILLQEHAGSGTREVHNKLEKNRRAHLKECFDALKKQLPNMDDRKTSNLSILRGAIRYIQTLKRKEREYELDLERLAREKIAFQQQLSTLKKDLTSQYDHIDVNAITALEDHESTTTASECGSDNEDDFPNEISPSNHSSRLMSEDATSSASSSSAATSRSLTNSSTKSAVKESTANMFAVYVPAFSKAGQNSAFPNSAKNSVLKGNIVVSEPPQSGKMSTGRLAPVTVSELQGKILINTENKGQPSRVISANNLHAMSGILTAPHAVQVITPPSNIKLVAASNPTISSPVQQLQMNNRQQGQIHVLASSSVSYMGTSTPNVGPSSKSIGVDQLVRVAESTSNSKQQPVSLIPSQAFVSISQTGANGKNLMINQAQGFSNLITSGASNQLLMKQSQLFGTTFSMKNSLENGSLNAHKSGLNATLHIGKSNQTLIQPSSAAQNSTNFIPTEGLQVNCQVVSSRAQPVTTPACNLITPAPNVTQLVSQSPMTVPAGQLVNPGNQGITPLVGSVSVVSHTGAVHHHQILTQGQSLGKVLGSPLLKSVNQIPIIPQQFIHGSAQQMVKPVVVVSMPNIIHSAGISALNHRSLVGGADKKDGLVTNSQK